MDETSDRQTQRLAATLRDGERVTPLELFFDLVFVLALTQCTALMAHDPSWAGLAKGLLALALLWWAWVGYAWLTSTVDPEEGVVKLVLMGAMAGLLVVALCVPHAYGSEAVLFAAAYGVVRAAHIALFVLASRDDDGLRRSVSGLAAGTAVGVALLLGGALAGGNAQAILWIVALALDAGGPYLAGSSGWRLVPGHFAERHGLIVIIALGESIVAIGTGAGTRIDAGITAAAVIGTAIAGAMWWLYFDVVALVAERRLMNAEAGRERNEVARDSYSYLHFPMVAGIVLVALGLKKTLAHVGDPLDTVPAAALLGGAGLYLLAHVAFRWRNVHRFSGQRVLCAVALGAFLPAAVELPALATLGVVATVLALLIWWETARYAELRDRLRHQLVEPAAP
ncbi:MAG TPA: low temperature requirement protein A [Solirubrobacteraceae bacterium]|nr:low temperature requirement protein A [Solirubrobacteraceae bacterium]